MDDSTVARCWDDNAETWARHVRAGYDTFRDLLNNPAFFAFVGDLSGKEVLDAGCGEGYNTRLSARQGAKMTGVDVSERMIALAREEEQCEPLGIRYKVASASALPFPDESFDAVLSTMTLMDLPDYEGAVRDFWRVLRSGGLLAFNICHPCFDHTIRLWEYDDDGEVTGVRLTSYYHTGSRMATWGFRTAPDAEEVAPFVVPCFHRTLADIINPLCEAGFRIEAIAEPRPTEEACQTDSRLRKHQLIPQTLCVRARKASG